jgi:lysozyme
MAIPNCALDLIKRFEGCELEAYPDPLSGGSPWTIGWGSTLDEQGRPFKKGDVITQKRADDLLVNKLTTTYLPSVSRVPYFAEMTDEQIGSLLSFAYNLGSSFYGSSGFETISRKLKNKDWETLPDALLLYRNAGSSVEAGLKKRRVAEGALWTQGIIKTKGSKRIITALVDTVLKKSPIDTHQLSPGDYKSVNRGQSFAIVDSTVDGSHTKVVLDFSAGTWYIYSPHWSILEPGQPITTPTSSEVQLNVRYFPQRDSATVHALRMCFSSSCSMLAEYLKPGCLGSGSNLDDKYMTQYVFKYGDTTNPVAQIKALRDLGIESILRQNLTPRDVMSQIDKGIPVPVGFIHKGPLNAMYGDGHWVVIIGYDTAKAEWIINDPYGECDLTNGGYPGSTNGASMRYSFKNFNARWSVKATSGGSYTPKTGNGWGVLAAK